MAYKGLEAVTATGQTSWFSIQNTRKLTIHAYGSTATGFDATIQIRGSNRATVPASTFDGVLLATTTAEAMLVIDMPVRWIKHVVTSYTAGTISTRTVGSYS